ncbi:MAG: hypothetical protein PWP21_1377 [Thermosediminibacterales bacterium]|nr:hypothetical protein [Thermosediminibacterales bacterium]
MNKYKKVLSLLGIAKKANKLYAGEFKTITSIRKRKSQLVLISEDASENTKKKFVNSCKYYNTKYLFFGLKSDLGKSIGFSSPVSVLSIVDKKFSEVIIKEILKENTN